MTEEENRQSPAPALGDAVRWTLVSLLIFLLVEGALFRSGWYLQYLAPQSTAGQVELMHYWLNHFSPPALPEVLILGDSRMAEGVSARIAEAAVSRQFRFFNASAGGTSPRVWYYLLRDVDPTRTRFTAIVLPFDHYSDYEDPDSYDERITDLNYAVGRLRLGDCWAFARSMQVAGLFFHALAGCLVKGMPLHDDLNDLLAHPADRLKNAAAWRESGVDFLNGYGGKQENVSGISADWANRRIEFPLRLNQVQRDTIMSTVMPRRVPQRGALTRYRQLWFGKILGLYAGSDTRFILIEVPRAPLAKPESPVPATYVDSLRGRARIDVVPRQTFRYLEKPELFADGLHLNHLGREMFSAKLGVTVAGVLGGR